MRVGAVAFKLHPAASDGDFFGHLYDFVESAHQNQVQLLVFPEFIILELATLFKEATEPELPFYLAEYSTQFEEWMTRMSHNSGMAIIAGSHFKRTGAQVRNASLAVWPDGSFATTVKNKLTQYESQVWRLTPGVGIAELPDTQIGNLICYDSEFPEAVRTVCENGARVVTIPAFTETKHGFQRVRWCAHARTIENQVYAIHASLLGDLGGEPVPSTFGSSAILSPSINPFPQSGMLAETPINEEGLAIADLDFDLLETARNEGDVRNWNDRDATTWKLKPWKA